jgi:hypothetical protein
MTEVGAMPLEIVECLNCSLHRLCPDVCGYIATCQETYNTKRVVASGKGSPLHVEPDSHCPRREAQTDYMGRVRRG